MEDGWSLMPTPRLPFYEKDALRWRDILVEMTYELSDIRRCCNLPSIGLRVEDQMQVCRNLADEIDRIIQEKKAMSR